MTQFNPPTPNNHPVIPIDALTQIAQVHLDIETLEARDRDVLDFHDCAVWSIKAALTAAYLLGKNAGTPDAPH